MTSLPKPRSTTRSLGLAVALLALVSGPAPAAADATVEILWTATSGSGTTGGPTIAAAGGDTLTAEVFITAGPEAIGFYSVSLQFDTALDDELDLVSAAGFLPLGFDLNLGANPVSTQESTLAQEGNVLSFDALSFVGVANTTFAIGEVVFTVNAADSDGDDVHSGFFNLGTDGILMNDLATPIPTSFQPAGVDAPSSTPVPFAPQAVITTQGAGARTLAPADLDGDGDLDVLSTSVNDGEVSWSANTAGDASVWATVTIDATASSPQSIAPADLDGDGDLDALVSLFGVPGEVRWYENDGTGSFGAAQTVATGTEGVFSAIAADIDGDGDLDVVSASNLDDEVSWHENPGGASPVFTSHVIDEDPDGAGGLQGQADGAASVVASDLDGDGDLDLVVLSTDDAEISWFENDGTPAVGGWPFHGIGTFTPPALGTVQAADVDGDGDPDVLVAEQGDDEVAWFENDGTPAVGSWTEHTIETGQGGAIGLFVADLDGDGDLDALSAAADQDRLVFHENTQGDGSAWTSSTLSPAVSTPLAVAAADLDGDGDLDALSASQLDDKIAWYENRTIHRSAAFLESDKVVISGSALSASSIFGADVDGDGDLDALSSVSPSNVIAWYRNNDGQGTAWTEIQIDATFTGGANTVIAGDVDGDGDLDAIASSAPFDAVAWFENANGVGTAWTTHVIPSTTDAPGPPRAADLDRDGDLDVIAASANDGRLLWYENTAGDGSAWTERAVATATGGGPIAVADGDGDGDLDLFFAYGGGGASDNDLFAYENTAGDASAWTPHAIEQLEGPFSWISPADVDGDGDLDLAVTQNSENKVLWYENVGGMSFNLYDAIYGGVANVKAVEAADLDRDGDVDLAYASADDDTVGWIERLEVSGVGWDIHPITRSADFASRVFIGDVDGDGDPDLLSSSASDATLAWYPNRGGQFAERTLDSAPPYLLEGEETDVLRIEVTHRGRAGDGDLRVGGFFLRYLDGSGTPLTTAQADALIEQVAFHLDQGQPGFQGASVDPVVSVQTLFVLDPDGRQGAGISPSAPNIDVPAGETRTYLVVPRIAVGAAGASPPDFRIVHESETVGSSAFDLEYDFYLDLEAGEDVASGVVTGWSADSDGDGLADHLEAALGTNPASRDTDGDGLLDGEEVAIFATDPVTTDDGAADPDSDGLGNADEMSLYGTNPLLADSDGDGVDDGAEIGGATEPLDSSVPFASNPVDSAATSFTAGVPADLDGDGDLDLPARVGSALVWYANAAGDGSSWGPSATIASPLTAPASTFPVDLDADGDLDMLSISAEGVAWHENALGNASSWTPHGIDTPLDPSNRILPSDMDGDGDLDVVASRNSEITWYENDGSESTWTPHTVGPASVAATMVVVDLDRDGDTDVVGSADAPAPVVWHENTAGDGSAWTSRTLLPAAATTSGAVYVFPADLDSDDDIDLVVTLAGSSSILMLENLGAASAFRAGTISRAAGGVLFPWVTDLDGDGDLDVAAAEFDAGELAWWENTGSAGGWIKRRLATALILPNQLAAFSVPGPPLGAGTATASGRRQFLGPRPDLCCGVADLDGDGDADAVFSDLSGQIGWLENRSIHRSALFPEGITIDGDATQLRKMVPADLDGDALVDLVAIAEFSGATQVARLTWYRNPGDGMSPWVEAEIDAELDFARDVDVGDVDGDGDLDVVLQGFATIGGFLTFWYENRAGDASVWERHGMTSAQFGAGLDVGDVDGDGDLDAMTVWDWHENTAGDGSAWIRHQYATGDGGAAFGDMDGDGDLDLMVQDRTQVPSNRILLYLNLDGQGSTAGGITVSTSYPHSVLTPADVDGDGDLDIVSTGTTVVWHENVNGDGATWSPHLVADVPSGTTTVETGDVDGDGDLDILSTSLGPGSEAAWWENLDGLGASWAEVRVPGTASGPRIATADFDADGDLDVATQYFSDPDWRVVWHPNRGGQFALPTTPTVSSGVLDGALVEVLSIQATHRGRVGDSDGELAEVELRFEDEFGTTLVEEYVAALLSAAQIRLDDGSGVFEPGSDPLMATHGPAGTMQIVLTDGDPDAQVVQGAPRSYFVVLQMQADASAQTPNRFQVVHVTESSSRVEDASADLPLSLEFQADTSSGVIQALSAVADEDSDGLSNAEELNTHGTDPLDDDSDDDGLLDGDEVNLYSTDPLDADSDDDGLLDGEEVALGSDPNTEDTDADGVCDGGNQVGTCTQSGPDNCVLVPNPSQANGDAAPQGDDCQCGDVSGGDGLITAADVRAAREHLVGATPTLPFQADRCNVIGPFNAGVGDCDVADVFVLERIAGGGSAPVGSACAAFGP